MLEKDDWYQHFLKSPYKLPYDLLIDDVQMSTIYKSFAMNPVMEESNPNFFTYPLYKEHLRNRYYKNNIFKFSQVDTPYHRFATSQTLNLYYEYSHFSSEMYAPKSLSEIYYLKSSKINTHLLCDYTCQIYSRIFDSEPAHSCLVYGPPGSGKTEFIQAMAGETEFNCVIEHSHKYSVIDREVAVGLRYLKLIFESVVNYTPCVFVLEDIHLIGEKRPLSFYDDETVFAGLDKSQYGASSMGDIVKNTVFADYRKHLLIDYKKNTRSEHSDLIIKNYYCYSLFLGVSPPRSRGTFEGPENPYNLIYLKEKLNAGNNKIIPTMKSQQFPIKNLPSKLITVKQVPPSEIYVPPPTSPMAVFELKEKKKFKPTKMMPEII